ncbi:AraC family transcriptional regulator N-terminal domain-containing protein [Sphingomonas sp. ac-8]|uniref:AraC family transcriptional regulator n=1 Tax=Sphingomonas sp. ac-8 TaxID=3242977 RepID=UPI003A810BF5
MEPLPELAALLARHALADGVQPTALPRVALVRSASPTMPLPTVYEPSLCIVAQGAKEVQLGSQRFRYDPASFLLGAVDLPVMGTVTQASAAEPYLCLCVSLDVAAIAELVAQLPPVRDGGEGLGLILGRTSAELLDAATRLVALLDAPADAPVLAPLVERELLWRLLTGPAGPLLRRLTRAGGPIEQVSRAIAWLRAHYAEPVAIEQLAAVAGMSASALHAHFRTVTGLSPLRYRTRLRLQEARRLMLVEALDAASAGFRVGYGGPSQFSRDYGEAFGAPPARDVARLRAMGGEAVAA